MSSPVAVWGAADDLALAGLRDAPEPGALVVTLGADGPPGADVRWLEHRAPGDGVERVIAPAGEGAWRRAPWPVADSVFDLPEPSVGDGVLVVADPGLQRTDVTQKLTELSVPHVEADRLTIEELRGAAVVLYPAGNGEPLPARAMAVLAAGRILITAQCEPAFGLLAGIEYLPVTPTPEAARVASAVLAHWRAFSPLRSWGRFAAERHRASEVYPRLALDIRLEEEAPRTGYPQPADAPS